MTATSVGGLEELFVGPDEERYGNGELIVQAGDETGYLYLIKRGFVRQYVMSDEGEELTVAVYAKGAVFFIPWLWGRSISDHFFEAVGKVRSIKVGKREFEEKIGSRAELMRTLMSRGYLFANSLILQMQSMAYGNARKKMASVLLILAGWYGEEEKGRVAIPMRLTHRLLASMVGMARETTSLAVAELRNEGTIVYRRQRITVVKLAELEREAGLEIGQVRAI